MPINLPAIPALGAALCNADSSAFSDHADLTYRLFNNLNLAHSSAKQSLLTGSVFANATISSTNFSRSDFEGSQFLQSRIVDTNFGNCDIRSCRFAGTEFVRCNFQGALLSYCEFHGCEFKECNFDQAILSEIRSSGTAFDDCSNEMATITHGQFLQCRFSRMKFADCTFLLHIFDECSFSDCALNLDSLGAIYGLKEPDIHAFHFYYLGERQIVPDASGLIQQLFAEFSRRRWHFKLIMLAWNMGQLATASAVRALMTMFDHHANEGVLVQTEELRFTRRVIEHLASTERLPLIAASDGYERTVSLAKRNLDGAGQLQAELGQLALVFLRASERHLVQLEGLVEDFQGASTNEDVVVLMMRFHQRPILGTAELLNAFAPQLGIPASARFIRDATGSYAEWVATTVAGLYGFRLIMFALTGCVKDVNIFIDNVQELTRDRKRKRTGTQSLARRKKDTAKIANSVKSNKLLTDRVLNDFSPENIDDWTATGERAGTGVRGPKRRGNQHHPAQD